MTAMARSASSSPDCLPRFSTKRTPGSKTYGGRVAEIATALGQPLMPWQRHVADIALEINPETGRLRYREVVLTVPRQSGKTTLIMAVAIHRALGFGSPQRIIYAAQTRKDAAAKLINDQWPIVRDSPFAGLVQVYGANGKESFVWQNGSRHEVVANTEKAGHGSTLDLGFVDEAFAQVDDRLEQAFSPAMVTRPEPQQWVVSTAGTDASVFLNRKVRQGRQVVDDPTSRTAYFEWSADPDADVTDPATWWSCMPALGRTVTEETIRAELAKMRDNLGDFKRAYCNIPTASVDDSVLDLGKWALTEDPLAIDRALTERRIAVDMDPERTTVSIAAAGVRSDDGLPQVEIADQVNPNVAVDRIAEIVERYHLPDVVIDPASPANVFIAPLERRGITVTTLTGRDMTVACGSIYDLTESGGLRHPPDEAVTEAIIGARRRRLGDGWALDRSSSSVNISPFVAVVLALWAVVTSPMTSNDSSVFFLSDFGDCETDDCACPLMTGTLLCTECGHIHEPPDEMEAAV